MVYMGSKSRFAKELVPIINKLIEINNTETFIDCFCGGANLSCHPKYKINVKNKILIDKNKYLISLLKYVSKNDIEYFSIDKTEYNKLKEKIRSGKGVGIDDWKVGYYGFLFSFGGKFFDTYIKFYKQKDKIREMPKERLNNLLKQRDELSKVLEFKYSDYTYLKDIKLGENFMIYFDPPYKNKKTYNEKYNELNINHDEFWQFVREKSKECICLVSEYNAPKDFISIWKKDVKSKINNMNKNSMKNTENLFIHKSQFDKIKHCLN